VIFSDDPRPMVKGMELVTFRQRLDQANLTGNLREYETLIQDDYKKPEVLYPLHEAIRFGHKTIIKKLITRDADINFRNHLRGGETALHVAVERFLANYSYESRGIVEKLVNQGALLVQNHIGKNPLDIFVKVRDFNGYNGEHVNGVELLRKKHLLNILTSLDEVETDTNIFEAAYQGDDIALRLILKRDQSQAKLRDYFDLTPLLIAIDSVKFDNWNDRLTRKKYIKAIRTLINFGSDVNYITKGGHEFSPLSEAVSYDRFEIAKILLDSGAIVDLCIKRNDTPLVVAVAERASLKIVRLLLNRGANVNYQTFNLSYPGYAPLHFAAEQANLKIVKLLLEFQANMFLKNEQGQMPRDLVEQGTLQRKTQVQILNLLS